MFNIEHFGFIQFYTDNQSVEPKQTFVLVFCGQLELRQKLVHAEFLGKSTIVSFGALRVNVCSAPKQQADQRKRNREMALAENTFRYHRKPSYRGFRKSCFL